MTLARAPARRAPRAGYSPRPDVGARRAPDASTHITAVTADARACERFYAGLLGLERVEPPTDHDGEKIAFARVGKDASGPVLTFLVRPAAQPARNASTVLWRVGDRRELRALWEVLAIAGRARIVAARGPLGEEMLRFWDPDGLCHEVAADGGAVGPRVDYARSAVHDWEFDPGDSQGQAVRPGRLSRMLNRLLCSEDARLVDPSGADEADGRASAAPRPVGLATT